MEKINRLFDAIRKETNHQYRSAEQAGREKKQVTQAVHRELASMLERIMKRMEN